MSEPHPKIIVDDDWKSKVEAEKKTAQEQLSHDDESAEQRMPPASFSMLVRTLTTQALVALGQIPDPYTGQAIADLEVAQHFIDTLAMLQDKTKGNLSNEEQTMLQEILHQLRLAFVAMNKAIQEQTGGPRTGGIELP